MGALWGKSARIERQPVHPADVAATWADVSRAERRLLDWSRSPTLEEGLEKAVAWYQANRRGLGKSTSYEDLFMRPIGKSLYRKKMPSMLV